MGSGNQGRRPYLQGQTRMGLGYQSGKTVVYENDQAAEGGLARGPVREVGNPFVFDAGRLSAWQANVETMNEVSQDLSLFARVSANPYGESETLSLSPWDVQPDFSNTGTPFGGVVPVGRLQAGHLGCSDDWFFNMLVGATQRVAFVGSTAKFSTLMVPKYFLADDTTALRRYDMSPGVPLDTTDWNFPTPTLLENALGATPSQAPIFERKAMSQAWFGQGHTEIDVKSRTVRKFFGSLVATIGRAHGTLCPIAFGATHVTLNGIGLRGAAPGVPVPLEFFQVPRGQLNQLVYTRYVGPYPGVATNGQETDPFTLIDNVEWIIVTSPTTFAGDDIIFELNYYLGA